MLLRRVTEHVRTQNWTAVGIDFIIVVVGVFIGIQVANWNDYRLERQIERDILLRLHEDFVISVAGISRDISFMEQQLADQAVVLSSLDACYVTPKREEMFQRGLATLAFLNPPRLHRRTIDEMAASGRTDIIRNQAISEELSRIVELVEWRGNWNPVVGLQSHRDMVSKNVRFTLEPTFKDPFIPDLRGGIAYDIERLCSNSELINLIAAVRFETHERVNAYRPILDRYQDFLPAVAAELRERWDIVVGE